MSEKRFVVETVEITDCDTDVSRIAKVITDTDETYSYEDLYEVAELLNEQQATIDSLQTELELISGEKLFSRRELEKKVREQDIQINELKIHIKKLVDGSEISQLLMKEYEKNDKLESKMESMTEQHKARLNELIEENSKLRMKIIELKMELEE